MNIKIQGPQRVNTTVCLPASKSISNRMLVLRELSGSKIELNNVSDCDDTFVMERALGPDRSNPITDVMAAGTAMRFLTALLCATSSSTTLTGTERMLHRPIGILVDALRHLGADINYASKEGFPPLIIHGHKLRGGEIEMRGDVSSQYISALLMVAPIMEKGLRLRISGEMASRPYVEMTVSLMRYFGIDITEDNTNNIFLVLPGAYKSGTYNIENDWSAASYWYEILALSDGGEIKLDGLFRNSLQGDSCIADLFEPLGVQTEYFKDYIILKRKGPVVGRYEIDLGKCPDLAQTLVATCCALNVKFSFSGLRSLRIKETDRLLALRQELGKLGYCIEEKDGSILEWNGQRTTSIQDPKIDTYNDHRMAMCMAPLSIRAGLLTINDAGVVSKSYPNFWEDLKNAGFNIETI